MLWRRHGLLTVATVAVVTALMVLIASLTAVSYASSGDIVVTFDDPDGFYGSGIAIEKGVEVRQDDDFKFAVHNWFTADGVDREINAPGNLASGLRTLKIRKVDNSPFTLVSFWSASLIDGTDGMTIRGFDSAGAVVATGLFFDSAAGNVITLPSTYSNLSRVEIMACTPTTRFRDCGGRRNNHMMDDITLLGDSNQPPDCSSAAPSTASLWPPSHKLRPITVDGVTDPDPGDTVTITIDSIFQDEPVNGNGDGDTGPDGLGVGSSTAQVRAERSGQGDGRVYHISYTAADGNGGTCTGVVLVGVPHDQGNGSTPVDGGALYDSTIP